MTVEYGFVLEKNATRELPARSRNTRCSKFKSWCNNDKGGSRTEAPLMRAQALRK